MLDLSTFAEEYILIKTHDGFRKFNDKELKEISEYQRMTEEGYSLKVIKSRLGSKLSWIK
jgi:DNA-binding transcriptional MerR regulator